MAYDYNLVNTTNAPVLSKVKIGDAIYFLKDADVRAILNTYGDIVTYNVEATLSNGQNIPTGSAVTTAIANAVKGIEGAMHFQGVYNSITAIDFTPAAGDVIIVGTKEYVYNNSNEWVELGDEAIYLTTANAEANYVQKTFTIAGIDMQDNITVEEVKGALGLKALAYKDSASATVTDYATGVADIAYTPAGNVEVTLAQTATPINSTGTLTTSATVSVPKYTPAGTVATTVTTEDTAATLTTADYTPAGDVSVTLATANVLGSVKSAGSVATFTEGAYTPATLDYAESDSFAKEGLKAAIDTVDTEMLVFSAASTGKASVINGFTGGSKAADTFNGGAMPTFEPAAVATGVQAASFTGTKAEDALVTAVSYKKATDVNATFTGTTKDLSGTATITDAEISVTGSYDKADVKSAAFTGTAATITPEVEVATKVITVQ